MINRDNDGSSKEDTEEVESTGLDRKKEGEKNERILCCWLLGACERSRQRCLNDHWNHINRIQERLETKHRFDIVCYILF